MTEDCTQFSLLMVSLARICGLPARMVSGFAPSDHNTFEPHMWVEIYVNGGWASMDPTFGELAVDAAHIACGDEDLEGNAVRFKILQVIYP
jgi:transglutaminase-like putative cysteine protease